MYKYIITIGEESMKNHNKLKTFAVISGGIILAALTGCGVKGSYTRSSTVETMESTPYETERQTEKEAEKVTEPIAFENGRYYFVKDKDSEDTVSEVRVHGVNGELYIEYDGKQTAVPWARSESEIAADDSFYLQDVTGDGIKDLIGKAESASIKAVFVYDLKNEKDLSPYYCVRHNLDDGLYTKEEYSSRINEAFKALTDESGETPIDVSCMGSFEPLVSHAYRDEEWEKDFDENGVLKFTYGGICWHCTVEYDFTGGECNMRIAEAETQYSRLKELFDVHGENILEARVVAYNKVIASNEDIEITVTSGGFNGNGRVILKYKDWEAEREDEDWYFRYDSDKVYFEFYDYDGDGADELLYHTVLDGEDEVLVYEFEQ